MLNAALATIDSMQPRSELQAVLAVQIIATGSAGLRFLRQSYRQMTEDYINVYGNYAIKLLRLQNEMIQTFERYRRGNKQTVEVRHVHIHSGVQGVDLIPKHIRFLGSDYLPRHWKIAQPHSGRHREVAQTSNPWPSPQT
jgi:hypothetical protein